MSEAFTAQTSAGPIAGWTDGEADAPALLLLHGGPGLSEYMSMLDAETRGWRTIRFQQRGLAPSALDGPFTVEQAVADAIAVLDELGVSSAVVLGHSWGAQLALHLALAHPDRVTGLVLVDGYGVVGDGGVAELNQHLTERLAPENMAAFGAVAERLGAEPTEAGMTEFLRLLWPSYFADQANVLEYPAGLRMSPLVNVAVLGSAAEEMASGFAGKLAQVTAPTVFLLGEQSPMPVSQGEQTAALLPGAEVVIVPGAGHLLWHEQPGSVAQALSRVRR
jgi:proline iminopeptidase